MSTVHQKNTLTYNQTQKKLNEHLVGLEVMKVQNSTSDSRRLFITIYSKKNSANFYLSIGTDIWTWEDAEGTEIPIFKNEFIEGLYHMLATTDAVEKMIKDKLTIKEVKLTEESKELFLYFEDGSILRAEQDATSQEKSFYQLILDENETYQDYNILILDDFCSEEFTKNGQ